jgi:nucleoid-associated protein YgaU
MTASGRALLIVVVVTVGLAGFVAARFVAEAPAPPAAAPATAPPGPVAPSPELRQPAPRPPAATGSPAAAATPQATAPQATLASPRPATVPSATPQAAATPVQAAQARAAPTPPPQEPPRFDVVRVGARGAAVVAGRAAAGAEVLLMEDGREIARARADGRGEWVILPSEPLRPGTRRFVLLSRLGGEEVIGPDTVVVVVPEPAPATPDPATRRPAIAVADAAAPPRAERQPPAAPATAAEAPDLAAAPDLAEAPAAEPAARRADAASPRAEAPAQPLIVLLPAAQPEARVLQRGAAQPGLAIGQVDYDDAGGIRFAGTAPSGATLRLYVNDRHAGDAQADEQGRWTLAPGEAVEIGRHRLRVDQIAAAGVVAARIEVPFQRDRLPESATADGRIVVQPGHSLWRLARTVYGRGVHHTVIYEANREQIRNPNRIFPGQVFSMPGMSPDGAPATPAESSRSR